MNQHVSALKATVTLTGANRDQLRPSGVKGLGDVPWGAHFCQFYDSDSELLEILVPYFAAGLASNEFCMWITSETIGKTQAMVALRAAVPNLQSFLDRGQLEILDFRDWYKITSSFDAGRVCRGWNSRYEAALARGFDGMRVSGDTSWLQAEEWDDFVHYEKHVDPIIGSSRMIALCTYSLAHGDRARTCEVMANHQFALLRQGDRWGAVESYGRRRAERALRQSEIRLRATIESATDGIITVDERGEVTLANPAAAAMFGYRLDELLGESVALLLGRGRGSRERNRTDYLAIVDRGYFGRRRELHWRHRDGSAVPVECAISEIRVDHPSRLFVICLHDLTERRQIEARVRQLHSDRLLAMGGMATTLAHELNQPLTATVAYLKAAKRILAKQGGPDSNEAEAALAKACEQVLRAGDIIRHTREFIARREPNKTCERLHALIESAWRLTAATAAHAGVIGALELDAGCDRIVGDAVQLKQVMVNLIRNAIEALQGADVRRLVISTAAIEGGMIRVDIADTGPGLSEAARARLFEPFKTSKAVGLGVGLALSRSIIEAHYGKIWAELSEGGGTALRFTLPLAE
ncbi:MEDS domain-containing protein [Methylosinus sp. Sm6]|uniref:MEDS domain-containing protein n=1 Tax=Methylosinus sp. Sm6 TaxID=2866948 RepID=UPI001C990663|nr:MEDS domain-containing protein [Methylosinus sp. Sm6]MBY6242176.1 MEDS domain-containing protein [Methylosinus sp. Sm6]